MAKYRLIGTITEFYYLDIEAASYEAAWEQAKVEGQDIVDWIDSMNGPESSISMIEGEGDTYQLDGERKTIEG